MLEKRCAPDRTGKYWCPTSVKLPDLEYVSGKGKWGFCSDSCPPLNNVTQTITQLQSEGIATFSQKNTTWKGKKPTLSYQP